MYLEGKSQKGGISGLLHSDIPTNCILPITEETLHNSGFSERRDLNDKHTCMCMCECVCACVRACLCVCVCVPAGSPSRGRDFAVYDFDINQPSLPTPFYSVLVYFGLSGPFNCISFHKFSRHLPAFSLCSSGLLSHWSLQLYIFFFIMKVSFSPDVILCG